MRHIDYALKEGECVWVNIKEEMEKLKYTDANTNELRQGTQVHADGYAMDIYEQFMVKLKKLDDVDKNYIYSMLSKHPFLAYKPSTDEFVMLQYDDPVVAEKNDGTPIHSSEIDRL